jgi:uncharacterized protein YjbI with pentapeptide repeats
LAGSLRVLDAILCRLKRDALAREASIGLALAIVGVLAAMWIANRQDQLARDLESASEVQENVRFVRQVAIDDAALKPFRGLNLRDATLSGLVLRCRTPPPSPPSGCADFERADLSGADMVTIILRDADLMDAKLRGADLQAADLTGAFLRGADLSKASLVATDLTEADLVEANLTDAELFGTHLRDADLTEANLTDASLYGAYLEGADLSGANLAGADLTEVEAEHMCYDDKTRWPDDFTPPPLSCD